MSQLYVLFEHASGYALFRIAEAEEVGAFLSQVQKNISDVNKFKSIVELISFQPFTSGRDALENMNSVTEGILHPHLQNFLEINVPKSKKKHHATLGVQESKLAAAISESLGISCTISRDVPEIIRGIRLHFHNLVKGFKDLSTANKAELGLGHHYSRARVKFNVNKIDNMIIQSISLIDQLDKDINTFSMRVREWYSHHFPELIKLIPENHLYIQCVRVIKDRKSMPEDVEEQLTSILMDADKAHKVIEVTRSSMGMEISPLDMENVIMFAERINSLMIQRKNLIEYLRSKMQHVAPNLAVLIGDMVGARLIAHAGSLINLAKFPASTVQILGAEKALFRALKSRGNTPKYGLIYHSTFIGRAAKANKGRISRYLANKCSVASRIDCFREISTEVFGQKLRQQVEDRLKFYETGEIPAKNVDVMMTAVSEAEGDQVSILKKMKKARKEKKRMLEQMANSTLNSTFDNSMLANGSMNESLANTTMEETETRLSKEKIHTKQKLAEVDQVSILKKMKKAKKKGKKRMSEQMTNSTLNSTVDDISMITNESMNECVANTTTEETDASFSKKKKHKKQKMQAKEEDQISLEKIKTEDEVADVDQVPILQKLEKAKKKGKKRMLEQMANSTLDSTVDNISMLTNESMNGSNAHTIAEEINTNFSKKKKQKKQKMSCSNES